MGAALLIAAPQALGVDRHHAPRRTEAELLPERVHEGRKGARKLRRIKQPEHPREGVVRGRPMRQRNQRRKLLGVATASPPRPGTEPTPSHGGRSRREDHGPRAKSRSSWPSGPSPKRKAPSESSFKDLATQYSPKCDSPARPRGGFQRG